MIRFAEDNRPRSAIFVAVGLGLGGNFWVQAPHPEPLAFLGAAAFVAMGLLFMRLRVATVDPKARRVQVTTSWPWRSRTESRDFAEFTRLIVGERTRRYRSPHAHWDPAGRELRLEDRQGKHFCLATIPLQKPDSADEAGRQVAAAMGDLPFVPGGTG